MSTITDGMSMTQTQQAICQAAIDLTELALSTAKQALLPLPQAEIIASTSHSLNMSQTIHHKSVLFVNVKELNLRLYNEIVISWNILESTTMHDWIGIYRPTSTDSSEYLDLQRVNGSKIGHITWSLNKLKSLQGVRSNQSKHQSTEPTMFTKRLSQGDILEFRYYTGSKANTCLASSTHLRVLTGTNSSAFPFESSISANLAPIQSGDWSPAPISGHKSAENELLTFKISDLKASQLRKGMFFNPDPYVKITIVPGFSHSKSSGSSSVSNPSTSSSVFTSNLSVSLFNGLGRPATSSALHGYIREYKTFTATNTCFPHWKNENFVIVARENDRVLFEVKDKFARTKPSINRFLGRVIVDLQTLIDKTKNTKGYNLTKRSDNSNDAVTGSLAFTFCAFSVNKFQHTNTDQTLHPSLPNSPGTPTSVSANLSFNAVNVKSTEHDIPFLKSMHKQNFQQQLLLNTPATATSSTSTAIARDDPEPVFSLSVDVTNTIPDVTIQSSTLNAILSKNNENGSHSSASSSSDSSSSSSSSASSSDETTKNEYLELQANNNESSGHQNHERVSSSNSPNSDDILPISASSTSCSSVCGGSNEQVDLPLAHSLATSNQPPESQTNPDFKSIKLVRTASLATAQLITNSEIANISASMSNLVVGENLLCTSFNNTNSSENIYLTIFESREKKRSFMSHSEKSLTFFDVGDVLNNAIRLG